LGRISRSVCGDAAHWPRIAAANPLVNPNQLFVGQVLRIPPLGAPAPTSRELVTIYQECGKLETHLPPRSEEA
jgi:hypothetical protein